MQQKPRNPALAKKNREKLIAVREAIGNLVKAHFPDSTPDRLDESGEIFGIDQHPRDDEHHMRVVKQTDGHEDMFPAYLHCAYNLTPSQVTQDASLGSSEQAFNDLRNDLNRMFTGSPDGETFKVSVSKDGQGNVTSQADKPRVFGSCSEQYHSINLLLYDSLPGLYDRMKTHLAKTENADLRQYVPRSVTHIG